jgi:hypothetical protein
MEKFWKNFSVVFLAKSAIKGSHLPPFFDCKHHIISIEVDLLKSVMVFTIQSRFVILLAVV